MLLEKQSRIVTMLRLDNQMAKKIFFCFYEINTIFIRCSANPIAIIQ